MENEKTPQVNFTTPEVTNVSPDSFTVAWNCGIEGVPEDSVSFEVFVKGEMADGSPFDRVQAPERNTCTISGLKEDTTYSVYVVAVHEGEDVAQVPDTDDGLVFTTPKNVPPKNWKKIAAIAGGCLAVAPGVLLFFLLRDTKPPVIDNPVLSSVIKDDEVALTWNPAKDKGTKPENIRYIVSRTDESGEWMEPQLILGDTAYTFAGLKPWTDYQIRVEALDKKGNGSPYTVLSVKTADSDAPDISGKSLLPRIYKDKIVLTWNPATDKATDQKSIRYKVSRTDESGEWMEPQEVRGDTSYNFTELTLWKKYLFRVEAMDEADNATPYPTISARTPGELAFHICYNDDKGGYSDMPVPSFVRPYADNGKFNVKKRCVIYLYSYFETEKTPVSLDNSYIDCQVSDPNVLSVRRGTINGGKSPALFFDFLKNGTSAVTLQVKDPEGDGYLLEQTFAVAVANPAWEKVPVTGVTTSPSSISLISGQSQQLSATVSPNNASDKSVTWSSGNNSVAMVSSNGLVKAAGRGSTTIMVTTADGAKTASTSVKVSTLFFRAALDKKENGSYEADLPDVVRPYGDNGRWTKGRIVAYLYSDDGTKKQNSPIKNAFIECTASDYSVVSIMKDGISAPVDGKYENCSAIVVKCLKNGTSTVTFKVKDPNGSGNVLYTKTFTMEVKNPEWDRVAVSGVTLSSTNLSLVKGQTQQLWATISPSNATNKAVSWSSGSYNVASVNSNGLVKAEGPGSTTVTVMTSDGSKKATANVKVTSLGLYLYSSSGDLPVPEIVWPYSNDGKKFNAGNYIVMYLYELSGNEKKMFPLDNAYMECVVADPTVLSVEKSTINGGKNPAIVFNFRKEGRTLVTVRVKDPKGSGYLLQKTFTVDLRH